MLNFRRTALIAFACSCTLASAQKIEGVPVSLGDTVEAARAALKTDLQPEESQSVRLGTTALRLKTKGIWVFFDKDGKAYNIRLDAPFAGGVGGVKIGNTRGFLVETLGKPATVVKGVVPIANQLEPHIYYVDDRTTVRFDFDRDGQIDHIFITK